MTSLAMLVPSRGRPESVARMAQAWGTAGGIGRTELIWVVDHDDPQKERYLDAFGEYLWMQVMWQDRWSPMVPKLNEAARFAAGRFEAVGFMGDDHLPRSAGWDEALAGYIRATSPSIVYGMDGWQNDKLPTWWAMSSSIINLLGVMVPAPVQHLYCDNAIKELGRAAKALHYLPHVMIEHMHPVAGKAEWDAGYTRVNRPAQYAMDEHAYRTWLQAGLRRDATLIAQLRGV